MKNGKKNYKEQRILKELQPIIDKKIQENPDIRFSPATTFEELEALHRQYTSEETTFEEIKNNDMAKKNEKVEVEDDFIQEMNGKSNDTIGFDDDSDSTFIDPFNREEPTTYDYTLEGGLSKDNVNPDGRTDFAEPMSFDEAFVIPDDSDDEGEVQQPTSGGKTNQGKTNTPPPRQKREKQEPFNPSFDDMSGSKKKKSTKKFAKYIVEAVCALAEKGFVWYANKDINDSKLAEYEMNGEMDLSLLVTLADGQEATIKQFFQGQCFAAEQLAKFEDEEKADMTEALTEVFMEKGIAPTATQELMIVVGGVLVKKGAMLFALKSQTNSLLDQLRVRNEGNARTYEPQPQTYEPQPQPQGYEEVIAEPIVEQPIQEVEVAIPQEEVLEIEQVIETKE
jgi:hypothetical protein